MMKTRKSLLDYVRHKIAQIETGDWGGRASPVLQMGADAGEDPTSGVLRGRVDVVIATRTGTAVLATIELAPLANEIDVDDAMADVLSKVLMDHSRWPR